MNRNDPRRRKRSSLAPAALGICVFAVTVGIGAGVLLSRPKETPSEPALAPVNEISVTSAVTEMTTVPEMITETVPEETEYQSGRPRRTEKTEEFKSSRVTSKYGLLVDAESMEILATNKGSQRIYPASMTKVMTLLVAAEHLTDEDMDKKYTMSFDLLHPLVMENASRAGFDVDEEVTVKDMLYGLILPSGADAAIGLSEYVAGSEDKFVELMNEKADELGLKNTHFTNVTGLQDTNHYTTCSEMAMIMKAAMDDRLCRKVLSEYTYTTSPTEQHPEGIVLYSTMFSRMYGNEVDGVDIIAGKTGYTDEAGNCLVSYAEKNGKKYICVLAKAPDKWDAVYSTFNAYSDYLP
ncbi:MAG: serine hydrolase [Oscillospiraceae bacterium]|nr:serine hydrolase [Oscillospiraceae bacterium]